jgi:hypothetical protein
MPSKIHRNPKINKDAIKQILSKYQFLQIQKDRANIKNTHPDHRVSCLLLTRNSILTYFF